MQDSMYGDCRIANMKSIRAWYDKGTLCILAEVEVPSPCYRADIVRSPLAVEPPHFCLLQCRIPDSVCNQVLTTLTIRKLFAVGSFRETVIVAHAQGQEEVTVQKIGESVSAARVSLHENDVTVASLFPASLQLQKAPAEAVGYSDSYSFKEALENAVTALPPDSNWYPDKIVRITVVETGVELGGIVGFNHLYVRVRRM